ncbi:MAG TPA: PepSY domain-containing protein [Novosphingobium sp.]|nr:PepSY domain-containing protein [Novosphingobium sp.]
MMKSKLLAPLAAAAAVLGLAQPAFASHPPTPRISMAHARAQALRLAPGRVISAEYENEGGIWRYSFDIQQRGNVQEIGIDAMTGRVVENRSEGRHDRD